MEMGRARIGSIASVLAMSARAAYLPKADFTADIVEARFVPIPDIRIL